MNDRTLDLMEEPRVAIVRTYRPAPGNHVAHSVHARRVHLRRRMTVEEAFRATVLECLAQIGGNAPAIRAREPEGVHQIRVGLRRLQMALKSFGDYANSASLKALSKRGRAIAGAFGPARELDVFAAELLAPVAQKFAGNESFTALHQALRHARGEAWDDALGEVLNPDFAAFLNDVAAAAETVPMDGRKITKAAAAALEDHWSKVRKRSKKVKKVYDTNTHHLRIALKKLRYASEFFAPLYSKKKVVPYIKALKRLLDRFGAANDVHGIDNTIARLGSAPELRFAAGAISGWHQAREKELTKLAMDGWKQFRKRKPFWK
ncbi:MAG: CHAD domain-containing protein [Alphaproteobacteria bacterium]|nr:CHAD domain-containing protein [Alphaproteobacteria bacterium]MBL7099452.1 CHAD domain-containing protein [Alphaproteobacteria bacterium]